MKIRMAALSVVIGMTAASCSENNPAPAKQPTAILPEGIEGGGIAPSAQVTMSSPSVRLGDPSTPAAGNTPSTPTVKPPRPREQAVTVPKDAQWTIFCSVISGPNHTERASALKASLTSRTRSDGRAQWYVVHSEAESTIYYGFYSDIDRKIADGKRAQADRGYLQALADTAGEHPLQQCYFLRLDGSEAEDLPQFNLGNLSRSNEQYWTLQVAAFTADKERRQAAIDAVKRFRSDGTQAYYFHGESTSSVTIGIWPRAAVREQTDDNGRGNAGTIHSTDPLLVTDIPLAHRVSQPIAPDGSGRKMKAVSPRLEIVDPSLLAATRRWREHAVNGYNIKRMVMNPNTGRKEEVLDPSFLALVPEARQQLALPGMNATDPSGTWSSAINDPTLQSRPQAQLPGVGRLRSSGD